MVQANGGRQKRLTVHGFSVAQCRLSLTGLYWLTPTFDEKAYPQGSTARTILSYREQLTPQQVTVDIASTPRNVSAQSTVPETPASPLTLEALMPTTGI